MNWQAATAAELRRAIRAGEITGPTAGLARGFAQANLVIVPADDAHDFAEFCRLNPQACPLICTTAPGAWSPGEVAEGADLRTDLPRYRVFRHGVRQPEEPTDVCGLWRDDLVSFLLGCSFTFEQALVREGLAVRHLERGTNVPMFRTTVPCRSAGRFAGPLVVSMRPFRRDQVPRVVEITTRFPAMHGPPVAIGDPARLGIADVLRPDFGDPVPFQPGEIPVFWACGVTPQLALEAAAPTLAITHSPGSMFVMDRTDASYEMPAGAPPGA